jgi:hypothetical protein
VPSSENLFSTLSYAIFVAPAVVVLVWVAWRAMVWCLFHASLGAAWIRCRPVVVQVPILIGLLPFAWPILLLALIAWIVIRAFPDLALDPGEVPRLFARARSRALSLVFVFCLVLPLVFVPLRYLAYLVEGPRISFWHWLLVVGPMSLLAIWFVGFIRRQDD